MDVQRRDDRFLDELSRMYHRHRMVSMQLTLWEYAYPEMKAFCDDLRACLNGADRDS